eukprot:scaffold54315_cov31-Tisochrysis_lutea.AAC.5
MAARYAKGPKCAQCTMHALQRGRSAMHAPSFYLQALFVCGSGVGGSNNCAWCADSLTPQAVAWPQPQ